MAKGYLIAQSTITDADAFGAYQRAAGPLLRAAGARLFVKPDSAIVKEGSPKARVLIFEFDSFGAAERFWDSPEYQAAITLRAGASESDFILIEGAD